MSYMKNVICLYKEKGETPLESLRRFQSVHTEYMNVPLTYAGRLDPLAEGVLLVLAGEECKKKGEYLGLDKVYEVDILFGISTDTYDILGIIENSFINKNLIKKDIEGVLKSFVGVRQQKYPPYSSKTVSGKALFQWAKDGKIKQVCIPCKEVEIFSIDIMSSGYIKGSVLLKKIQTDIQRVSGDFRQEKIIKKWKDFFDLKRSDINFFNTKVRVHCSSGTYMRNLAYEVGVLLGTGAVALDIKRISIGEYCLSDCL